MRYIIALLALFPELYIQEAQKQFAANSEGYLLSQQSLPHITIAQFDSDDKNLVTKIWNELQAQVNTIPQPRFTGIGFSRKAKNLWGASLSVAREPELVKLHLLAVEILKKYNLNCVSDLGERYRPHLTLARIKELRITEFDDTLLNSAPFTLALGEGDNNGQYLKTVFKRS